MLKTVFLGGTLPRDHWLRRWLNWFHNAKWVDGINNTCDLHKAVLGAGLWTLLIAIIAGLVALALIAVLITNPVGFLTSIGLSALFIAVGMGIVYACTASRWVERIVVAILLILSVGVIIAILVVFGTVAGMWVGPSLHHLLPGIIPEIPSESAPIIGPELWVGLVTLTVGCAVVYGLIWLGTIIWEPLRRLRRRIVESAWWKSLKGVLCCPFAWTD